MGAFLHDVGKIDELAYERDFAYTDEGQLIGHVVMAVGMLEKKLREAERLSGEPMPDELVLRLKHMIVSHHGQYEYGSPKLPMTLEAVALHQLDNLDAKIHSFDAVDARRSERRKRLDQFSSRAGPQAVQGRARADAPWQRRALAACAAPVCRSASVAALLPNKKDSLDGR